MTSYWHWLNCPQDMTSYWHWLRHRTDIDSTAHNTWYHTDWLNSPQDMTSTKHSPQDMTSYWHWLNSPRDMISHRMTSYWHRQKWQYIRIQLAGRFLTIFSLSRRSAAHLQCMWALFPPLCFLAFPGMSFSSNFYNGDSSTKINCLLGNPKKLLPYGLHVL